MRYSLRHGVVRKIKTGIINTTLSAVLLASGLSGSLPLLLTQRASAAVPNRYVATTGADNTDCSSSATPCQTITYAISQAASGDIIDVAAGTYTESVSVNKSVTLQGEPGATLSVTANPANATDGFDVHANDVTITGFEIVGPASTSYLTYAWGSTVTRGIFIYNGVTNFAITGNTIKDLRNDILIDGRNTGLVTNNVIDNSKSGISVQYTDGTGYDKSLPGSDDVQITITGNSQGTYGNEWGVNYHLNGYWNGVPGDETHPSPNPVSSHVYLATEPTTAQQQALLANSAANDGWTVQDQAYQMSNRTAVTVDPSGSDTSNQGSPLAPLATIQTGVDDTVTGGTVNVNNGNYSGSINVAKGGLTIAGQSQAGVVVTQSSATPYGQGVSVNGQSGVTIKNMTFTTPVGAPVSYAFQAYQSTGLTLDSLTFNGPGKTSTHIGGVDVSSSQNITYDNVSASDYYKNGFSFTAKYAATDTATKNVSLSNITASNNGWAGLAFYTVGNDKSTNSPSSTGGTSDISGVTFGGNNTFSGNLKGIQVEGDSDANEGANATPQWGITGSSNDPVDIGSSSFSGNAFDIINYQPNNLEALSATFNGKTGADMTGAERTTEDGLIVDQLDNSNFGLVHYYVPYTYNASDSKFLDSPNYIRSGNTGDVAAEAEVPAAATATRFTFTGPATVSDVAGYEHIQAGQWPDINGNHQYRVGVSLPNGQYTVTGEYEAGGQWYPITGTAITYSIDTPWAQYVIPQSGQYFRANDKVVRVKADDEFDQFDHMVTTINGVAYTVSRADCSDQGSYVLCDLQNLNLPEGTYTASTTTYTKQNPQHVTIISPSFTIDNTRPTLTNFHITNTHTVYGSSVSVAADASDNNGVSNVEFYVTAPRAGDGVCDGNGTHLTDSSVTSPSSGSTYSATLNTSGLNGTFCLNAIAGDVAANHSLPVATISNVVLDNIAPTVDITNPGNNDLLSYAKDGTVDIRGTVTDAHPDHYYLHISGPNGYSAGPGTVYDANSFTDQSLYPWNLNGLASGTYTIDLEARDAAGGTISSGNKDAGSVKAITVTVDNTAPTGLQNLSPSDGTDTTTAGLTSIDWSDATDPNGPVTYYYESSSSSGTNTDGSFVSHVYQSGALTDSTIPTPGTPEGVYYWHVKACDAAGNCTAWTDAWKVTVDDHAPTVSITSPTDFATPFAVGPTITADASDTGGSNLNNVGIEIFDASTNASADNSCTDTSVNTANHSVSCDLSHLPDGTYYAVASASDNSGNNASADTSPMFTIDSTAPHVTVHSFSTYDTTPNISGTVDDPNATVTVTVGGHTYTAVVSSTANHHGTYDWSVHVYHHLSAGHTYGISVSAKDAAGNVGTASGTVKVRHSQNFNAGGGTPFTPLVLGASTGSGNGSNSGNGNNSGSNGDSDNGHVKGASISLGSGNGGSNSDSSKTSTNNSRNFFGLGWWWLLVLAALVAGWWFLFARRRGSDSD